MVRIPKRGPRVATKPTVAQPLIEMVRIPLLEVKRGSHNPKPDDDTHGMGKGEGQDLLS